MLTGLYLRLALVAGLLAAVGGGWLYITHLQDRAETAERNAAVAESIAAANAATADAIRADAERQINALAEERDAATARVVKYSTLRETIRHAPAPAQACPVDPAVRAAVGELWSRSADPGSAVGTADDLARTAGLSAPTGAAPH